MTVNLENGSRGVFGHFFSDTILGASLALNVNYSFGTM